MHYHAEVWVENLNDVHEEVTRLMEPHREADGDGDIGFADGFWDFWQIGGRYTGCHTPEYDPMMDPRNIEDCFLCHGTGFRRDAFVDEIRRTTPSYTCNGCGEQKDGVWTHGPHGPGKKTKWPTEWAHHYGDVIPVSAVDDKLTAYTLIVENQVFHMETWNGKEWVDQPFKTKGVKQQLNELGITTGYLVTVDYHS